MSGRHLVSGPALPGASRRGFSLIEILIAVLILGLGLLGLGALFPVVIREQRYATDRVTAAIALNNIRAELKGRGLLEQRVSYSLSTASGSPVLTVRHNALGSLAEPWAYWEWRNSNPASGSYPGFSFSPNGEWEPDWNWSGAPGAYEEEYRQSGEISLGANEEESARTHDFGGWETLPTSQQTLFSGTTVKHVLEPRIVLPLSARLFPAPDAGSGDPTLVWDVVPRRKGPDSTEIQFAVFIRRIDPRIRTGFDSVTDERISLRRSLLDPDLEDEQRRLPVGADAQNRPTLDGTDGNGGLRYSRPLTVGVAFDPPFRDRLYLDNPTAAERAAVAQVGQRLIDNLGNIYTVIEFVGDDEYVRVDPPVPAGLAKTATNDYRTIQQVVLTPQIPVAVFTMEVGQ